MRRSKLYIRLCLFVPSNFYPPPAFSPFCSPLLLPSFFPLGLQRPRPTMDPLSLTASIITIIGVGGQAAKAIRGLASLSGAPDLLLALNNEVSDLHLAAQAIQDILQKQPVAQQATNASVGASVTSCLRLANEKIRELEAFHQRLVRSTPTPGVPVEFDKTTWLRERKRVKRLQEDLRNVRINLWASLGLLSSYVTVFLRNHFRTSHFLSHSSSFPKIVGDVNLNRTASFQFVFT